MVILRSKEIRGKKMKAREASMIDLKRELAKLNSQKASGRIPENSGKIREIRRTVARILTINKEGVTSK
jgi:large subunit ribosomal protein L29